MMRLTTSMYVQHVFTSPSACLDLTRVFCRPPRFSSPPPPVSAARFLLHFNPDASAPLVGQTPSPEDDTIIRDLLPEDAGIDHQTVHQLIMVLMKFMAKDQSSAEADIGSAKAFNTVKRHLYVLLGYDQQEGCFMIAPQKMRTSTCFNAFIAGIAQVSRSPQPDERPVLIAACDGRSVSWNVIAVSSRSWITTLVWESSCSPWWSRS